MYKDLLFEIKGSTAIITINKPGSLNALNKNIINELSEALTAIDTDERIRVVILTGSGEKAFVAGADIKEFADFDSKQAENLAREGQDKLFNKVENFSRPIIAAVNGFALGGGLELAMSCHMRFASTNARLGLPEVTLGLIPGYGGTQRLPQLVGKGIANEIIFSAEMVSAERAYEIGLVNRVYEPTELLEKTVEFAEKIARNSPLAISRAIQAVNLSNSITGYDKEIHFFGELFDLQDKQEGVAAFLEKRKPNF